MAVTIQDRAARKPPAVIAASPPVAPPRTRFVDDNPLPITKRSFTPDGFLVIHDVPLARTGQQYYADGELDGISSGGSGFITAIRDADEVFRPSTLLSVDRNPITNDHPPEFVSPDNFTQYTVGFGFNIRRGTADQADLMLGDLCVMQRRAINDVLAGKVEISLGYDAEYVVIGPGIVKQTAIRGNHIAIVPKGRCGARCAIGDAAQSLNGATHMPAIAAKPAQRWKDRARVAFMTRDTEELEAALEAAGEAVGEAAIAAIENDETDAAAQLAMTAADLERAAAQVALDAAAAAAATDATDPEHKDEDEKQDETDESKKDTEAKKDEEGDDEKSSKSEDRLTAHITRMSDQIGALISAIAAGRVAAVAAPVVVPAGDAKTTDAAAAMTGAQEMQDTRSRAEVLAPGITMPTLDAKTTDKGLRDASCALRRRALTVALPGKHGAFMTLLNNGVAPEPAKMTCDQARGMFIAVSQIAMDQNSRTIGGALAKHGVTAAAGDKMSPIGGSGSNAEINRRNRERFGVPAAKKPA